MLNFRAGWNVQFLFVGIALTVMLLSEPLMAQSSKKTNVKQINVQADKLKDSFIRESAEIARKYSEAGDYEKSREMLEVIQSIQKDVPGVKAMITQLNEKLMSSNSSDFDIDVARNWSTPAGLVAKGKMVGIVISQEKGKPKMSKPFLIGEKAEFTPRADGVLMIGLNLPAGHKSTGKLKVRISGYIRRGSK